MRKWRNSTFLHSVRSSPSLLKYKQFTSVLRLKALSDVRLPLQSCDRVGFRPTAVSGFALLVFLHGPSSGAACLLRNLTRTKAYKNDFQLLPKELDAKVAKITLFSTRCGAIGDLRNEPHFELDVQQFFVIEGSCRSRPALEELDVQQFFVIEGSCRSRPALEELDVQQFFAVEGSCRSRPAHEELDGQQFFAIEGSCRRRISKWKVASPSCKRVTSSSAGYDCVINATVREGRV